jgi:uncharacterized protein DUF6597
MPHMERVPRPALRPFVRRFWAGTTPVSAAREHTLPTGDMHLVIRPHGNSIRIATSVEAVPLDLGAVVVGGVRTAYYVKDTPANVPSVGVNLPSGGCGGLVRMHRCGACRTTSPPVRPLGAGNSPAAAGPDLRGCGPRCSTRHPRGGVLATAAAATGPASGPVASTLEQLRLTTSVTAAVRATGYSHRTVADRFRETMGIGPKGYLQMRRMRWV